MRLLQLLKIAVMQARFALLLRVLALRNFLVETVTHALAKRIDARMTAGFALLVAHALVVVVWVEGAGTLQLDSLAMRRHSPVGAVGRALADIGTTRLRDSICLALVVEANALFSAAHQHGVLQALTATCIRAHKVKRLMCESIDLP